VAIETAKHGQDIALTWQGGGACQAIFELSESQGDTTYDAVCAFPSSDDSGTIHAAALAPFPEGTAPTHTFTGTVSTKLMVGDRAINVHAPSDARTLRETARKAQSLSGESASLGMQDVPECRTYQATRPSPSNLVPQIDHPYGAGVVLSAHAGIPTRPRP
jgi:hypothetical protein